VVGNGSDSLRVLIAKGQFGEEVHIKEELDLDAVPADGERVEVSWKHNLGQGSMPELVEDAALRAELSQMAQTCASVLGIAFASVDIIRDGGDGRLKVLEINSGVMMEKFSAFCPEYGAIAKEIYKTAVFRYLGLGAQACNLRTGPARVSPLPALLDAAAKDADLTVEEGSGSLPYARIARPDGLALIGTGRSLSLNASGAHQLARNHDACMDLLQQIGYDIAPEYTGKTDRLGRVALDPDDVNTLPGGYPLLLQPPRALGYRDEATRIPDADALRAALADLQPNTFFRLTPCSETVGYGVVLLFGNTVELRRIDPVTGVRTVLADASQVPAVILRAAQAALESLSLVHGEVDLTYSETEGVRIRGVQPDPTALPGMEQAYAVKLLEVFKTAVLPVS
jgi:hypothetical protein